ncbi:MAG: S8 family serine peptidase [Clostridia bacterium]|nr:S8 family serine peptidase [Clostridia bacterium]
MKQKKIISIIISLIIMFSIVIIGKNGSFFREEIDYSKFQNEIAVACQNDDYNGIVLDKDISFDETLEKLSNIDNNKLTINKNLFDNDKKSFFAKLDYTFKEQDGNYVVYSKFGLKRLIVQGDLTNFYGAKNVISGFKDYNILCYETEEETKVAYENLIKDKNLSVNVDFIVSTSDYADNSYDYSSYKSWGAEAIGVAPYLDYLEDEKMTSKEVVVAVIDTGINTSHEMFNGRFLLDDNDEIIGYSYSQTKYTYSGYAFEDDNGHGTHVSGIICDVTPSNVKILPIRALDDKGDGSFTNILAGLSLVESLINKYDFACVNMSLGNKSSSFDEDSHNSFNNLFSSLRNQGVLCAVAAGNESINVSQGVLSSCESAIVVSALKQDITFAYKFDNTYSNFGAIDVSAPGSNIKSAYKSSLNTANSKVYHNESGTSMATPFVAGAISLIYLEQTSLTNFNNLTSDFADKIENILKENTLDFGDKGYDEYYGYGLVNLKYFNVEKKGDLITFKNDNLNSEIVTTGDYYHFTQSFTLSLDFSDDYEILYTDDGTIPNLNSKKYVSSIEITETVPMCFMGVKFDSKGNISEITNFYNIVFFNSGESIWSYLDYYSTNGKVYITTYTGHFKNLVIPDAVYDNKGFVGNVVAIRSEVFKQNSALESVTLPSTCTRVYSNLSTTALTLKKLI